MHIGILSALLIPFLGTTLGSSGVFFLREGREPGAQPLLNGFAAGVMAAASVWSLILPAIRQSCHLGELAFLPAFLGIWAGFVFIPWLEPLVRRLCRSGTESRTFLLILAVALHNLPEGMAAGAAAAGLMSGSGGITAAAVVTLSLGIGIQNIPEGAIVSMPLNAAGTGRFRAFFWGVLSGAAEPLGAGVMLLLAGFLSPALPFLLSFAAGAMLYVVVRELIPAACADGRGKGSLSFAAGFSLMMALDAALG